MTKQSNKRKFLATTLTATMVAAAVAPVAGAAAADTKVFPDVPADHNYAGVIADMAAAGIVKGETNGNFNLGGHITRAEAAQMVAGLLSLKTGAEANRTDFTDVKGDVWYTGAINSLVNAGVIAGVSEKTFAPNENITRGQIAQMLVVAYDLEDVNVDDVVLPFTDVADDAWYAKPIKILYKEGLINGRTATTFEPKSDMTRGDFTWLAANVDYVHGDKLPKPEDAVEASVVSVTAINASELKVTFSAPVTEKTATDKANYELKINNVDHTAIQDIQLSADGKVATILLDQSDAKSAFQNGDKYVIQTNDAIVSAKGKKLEKFVSNEATFSETAAPALTKVAKKGDSLELTFDRPVNAVGTGDVTLVKVDGIEIGTKELKPVSPKTVGSDVLGTAGDYRYTIDITNATAKAEAKKVGTHEVVIFDVEDTASAYASKASVLTGSYTVTDAVTTPEVTGIEAVNANRFFVYTNVPVTLGTDAVVTVNKGTHEFKVDNSPFEGTINKDPNTTVSDAVTGTYKAKPGIWVTVTDNEGSTTEENPLYRSGEAAVNLSVTVEKYTADGLIGKKSVQNVTLNKNNTKPVVDTTLLKENGVSKDELVVTFTNDLVKLDGTTGLTLAEGTDFVVRDKEGIIVTGFTAAVNGKDVTFEHDTAVDLKDAPYTVEFKEGKFKNAEERSNVASYLANTVKNDAFTVSVGKEVASNFKYTEFKFDPENTGNNTVVQTVDENSITFTYPTKMGDSARDVANYTLDGKALPKGTTVDFVNDRTTVKVVFPKNTFKTSTQYKFGVTTNVKTETGSIIVGSLQTKAPAELVFGVKDNVKPELASAVYYVGTETVTNQTKTNQIEVTFNEAVEIDATPGADAANDFAVVINGSRYDVQSVAPATIGDNTDKKLVLTLVDQINVSQAATITIVPESEQVGPTAISKEISVLDTAGNKAKEGSQTTLAAGKVKYSAALQQLVDLNQANDDITSAIAALNPQLDGEADVATQLILGAATNGTTLTWSSNNTDILTDTGVGVNDGTGGTALLTAKVNKTVNGQAGAEQTKAYSVVVNADGTLNSITPQ